MRKLGMSLDERVESGAQEDVLADAFVDDQILDEPGAGDDPDPIRTRADRMHVRSVAPSVVGRGEGKTDLVVDEVRRFVDLDVESTPKCSAHRTAVGFDDHGAPGA